jgi:phosphopantetheinyl transferase
MIERLIETTDVRFAIARATDESRATTRAACARLTKTLAPAGKQPYEYVSRSHCGRWIAVALSRQHTIGVDIEIARPRARLSQIAAWLDLDGSDVASFHADWTLREAIAKCTGGSVLTRNEIEADLRCATRAPGVWQTAGEYAALCGQHESDLYYALVVRNPVVIEASHCA